MVDTRQRCTNVVFLLIDGNPAVPLQHLTDMESIMAAFLGRLEYYLKDIRQGAPRVHWARFWRQCRPVRWILEEWQRVSLR